MGFGSPPRFVWGSLLLMPVDTKRRLGGASTATAGAPSAGVATQPQQAAPAAQKQVGTGFVNFSDILAANQSGAQAMGQALTNRVQQQGAAAQQAVKGAKDKFGAAVQAGTNTYNPTGVNSREQTRAGAARGYTGPRTWSEVGVDTAALAGQAAQAGDNARALTTQGGRAALLRETNPGLTAGGASLDAFLAGAGGGAQQRAVSAQYGNLSDILAGDMGGADAAVKDAERATLASQQQYRDLEAGWDRAELQQQYEDNQKDPDVLYGDGGPADPEAPRRRRAPNRPDYSNPRSP